jgi:hypothetical protein
VTRLREIGDVVAMLEKWEAANWGGLHLSGWLLVLRFFFGQQFKNLKTLRFVRRAA